MRSGPAATLGVVLGLALILPACGEGGNAAGGGKGTNASGGSATPKRQTAKASPAKTSRAKTKVPSAAKRCMRALGDFLDAIESLGNTLAVGLDENYIDALTNVRAAYAGVEAERLGIVCLARVAAPAERALNTYIGAANEWGECLATSSCDPGSIEAELQREWQRASARVSEARSGLRALA